MTDLQVTHQAAQKQRMVIAGPNGSTLIEAIYCPSRSNSTPGEWHVRVPTLLPHGFTVIGLPEAALEKMLGALAEGVLARQKKDTVGKARKR